MTQSVLTCAQIHSELTAVGVHEEAVTQAAALTLQAARDTLQQLPPADFICAQVWRGLGGQQGKEPEGGLRVVPGAVTVHLHVPKRMFLDGGPP